MAPIPAVRQKRSKELSTSCQAVLRLGTSASDEGVVIVVILPGSLSGAISYFVRVMLAEWKILNPYATSAGSWLNKHVSANLALDGLWAVRA
jgi:hypothetical protein